MRISTRTRTVAAALAFIVTSSLVFVTLKVRAQNPAANELNGFQIEQIRFDESDGQRKATPKIPKRWKFLAVANGGKSNMNTLWFQDTDGTIYLVGGFSTGGGKFIALPTIQKLEVSN